VLGGRCLALLWLVLVLLGIAVLRAAPVEAADARSLRFNQLSPADGHQHLASSWPHATDAEMFDFLVDTDFLSGYAYSKYLKLEVATRNVQGQDGTLADDFRVSYDMAYPSDAYPTQYKSRTRTSSAWLGVPGTYYWQFHLDYYNTSSGCSPCAYVTPVRSITITAKPTAGPSPAPSPPGNGPAPQYGGPRLKSFLVNTSFVPGGVGGRRFLDLAVKAGNAWGAFYRGNNIGDPAERDGENTIGFSYELPEGAAGSEVDWVLKRYRRGKKRCHTHRHRTGRRHRHCRRGKRRKLSEGVVEKDISINAALRWQAGPGHPTADEFDLEAVLSHEFGHFVGADHVHGCEASPMRHEIAPGDWWRSSTDWFRSGCLGSPGAGRVSSAGSQRPVHAAKRSAAGTAHFLHRRVVIEVTR
jgi:hypothetical protein